MKLKNNNNNKINNHHHFKVFFQLLKNKIFPLLVKKIYFKKKPKY